MTAKKLRKLLKELPDDAIVVLSSDAEGNCYKPLDEVYAGYYIHECGGGYLDDEPDDDSQRAAVLYPV